MTCLTACYIYMYLGGTYFNAKDLPLLEKKRMYSYSQCKDGAPMTRLEMFPNAGNSIVRYGTSCQHGGVEAKVINAK